MLSFFYFKSWEFIWILFFSIILLDWLLWNCKVVLLVNLLLWIWRADLLTVSYLFWSTRSGKLFLSIFLFIYFCKKVYGLLSSFIFYYNSTANLFFQIRNICISFYKTFPRLDVLFANYKFILRFIFFIIILR